jgi:hypothetical protein
VRIPGGDLAPARRRRYGGSYGRRRRRRNLRLALAALLLIVAGGAAYLLKQDDTAVPSRLSATPTCTATTAPTASRAPSAGAARPVRPVALPQPRQVHVEVLNGTSRSLLAKTVGDQLAALGFVVSGQGNASAALAGSSVVTFGPGAGPAATVVAHWVLGAQPVPSARAKPGSVQLVLGSSFTRLATPAEAAAAGRVTPTATPAPSARATASPC